MGLRPKNPMSCFDEATMEAIAKVLADTDSGLTGSELGQTLAASSIPDVDSDNTKWRRLYNAFAEFQNEHQVGNHIVVFIHRAMNPVRYAGEPRLFNLRKDRLNTILAFKGMELGDDGKVRRTNRAQTMSEAQERSNRFQAALEQRGVHEDVFRCCRAEVLSKNYFHAVVEAVKSITIKIRSLSGSDRDGVKLIDFAFGFKAAAPPRVAINAFKTATQRGEQGGFISLLKGLYGTVRNPLAHEAKVDWAMSEQDALDIMTLVSLIHRKLDHAHRTERP